MATWIKAGFWEKLCKPCQGYKGWLNLDQFVQDNALPYKVYSALLTQTGINPPVATVLQNTIGDIEWTRDDVGVYIGTLSGAFTVDKTFVILTLGGGNVCIVNSMSTGIDYVIINSNEPDSPNNPIDVDGMMQIEIRVYN